MPFLKALSLKARLTLITLAISLVCVTSLLIIGGLILRDETKEMVGQQQKSVAATMAAKIGQEVDLRFAGLQAVAEKINKQSFARGEVLNPALTEFGVIRALFNGGAFITGRDGKALVSIHHENNRVGRDYSNFEYVAKALQFGQRAISAPIVEQTNGAPIIVMAVPIFDETGQVFAALMGVIELDKPNFLGIIAESRYGKSGGYLISAAQHRRVIGSADRSLIMKSMPEFGVDPVVDRFFAGFEGPLIYRNASGTEVLSVGKHIAEAGWQLIAWIPTEEAFAPITSLQSRLIVPMLYFFVLSAMLIWMFVWRQLSPIVEAIETLDAESDTGVPPKTLKIARNDEVGRLIGGFNHLLATIRHREDILERTGQIAKIGGWELDLRSGARIWSRQILHMLDIDPPLSPKTHDEVRQYYDPSVWPAFDVVQRAAIDFGTPWDLEAPMITATGRRLWARVQGEALMENGKVIKLVGTVQDITEEKLARDARQEIRGALEEAQRLAKLGSWNWDQATDQIKWSREMYRIFDVDFVKGAQPPDFRTSTKFFTQESVVRQRNAVSAALKTGQSFEIDLDHVCPDGGLRKLAVRCEIVLDDVGKLVGLRGTVQDMTAQRKIEQELEIQRDFATQVITTMAQGLLVTDADDRFEFVNSAFTDLLGYESDYLVGKTPADISMFKDVPSYLQQQNKRRDGKTSTYEAQLFHASGRLVSVLITSAPRMRDGRFIGSIAVITDLTDRKLAEATHASLEAQLRESQKMQAIGTLAGGIAHDFNNILAAILGNAELARQDASDNPEILSSVGEILKAGTRGRNLVQQILSFSRQQPVEMKLLKMADAVAESVRLLRATLPARFSLDVQYVGESPMVMADVTQIEQVVINLVTNSMQAMVNGPGKICIGLDSVLIDKQTANKHPANSALQRLATDHHARRARLTVTDNGAGMDAKTLARIFEPFFTTKPVDEGTGLGLSVVHGIVESHDGAIVVESVSGKGTTFTIYLPLAKSAETDKSVQPTDRPNPAQTDSSVNVADAVKTAGRPSSSTPPSTPYPSNGQHILYVDDDDSMLFLVSRLLERKGFQVSAYSDQTAALDILAKNPHMFNLVVTDFNMPGMSGLAVARAVRTIRADLPVAIASGFIDETLRMAAADAGVRELLFKADGAEEFCDAVARLVLKA